MEGGSHYTAKWDCKQHDLFAVLGGLTNTVNKRRQYEFGQYQSVMNIPCEHTCLWVVTILTL